MDAPSPDAVDEASASQPSAGFLDLSAELKNKIYRLVLCARLKEDGFVELGLRRQSNVLYRLHSTPLKLTPGILATCKQVHDEAASILYGENAFAMSPETLLAIHSGFTTQTRFLKLHLSSYHFKALTWPSNSQYFPLVFWSTTQKLPRLRSLAIEGRVHGQFFENDNSWQMGWRMAKNLRPVVRMMRKRGQGAKVREVFRFSTVYAAEVFFSYADVALERNIDVMENCVYGRLEGTLTREV